MRAPWLRDVFEAEVFVEFELVFEFVFFILKDPFFIVFENMN